ncbi:FtsK/SpoIIIE domain-containing protein [Heyndrickxia sporothermodurans]|uniref:FtsK/SpoIIIE domain-containing protein n=2 Tax=Bacillati TaxID=1783272 RepID=UPI0035D7D0B2
MTKLWATLQARKRLINAFKHANVYRMDGDSYIFPTIRKVDIADDYTKFTLRLPTGLNPYTLTDNLYVFQQIFGPNVVIDGEIKYFTITVYRKGLPKKVPYNLDDWQPIIERMTLPIIVGRDRNNQPQAFDLADYPHVLISGETGSGKSSLLRAVLTTLLLMKSPDDVRFVLGDLKRSEFGLYRNIKHVDDVHVSPRTLLPALRLIKVEMERRGDLLDKHEVTHIKELPDKLPYIIVAIDEVALLRQEKEIMAIIEDISSIGRSLGVLLMLSMQRPDAKVLEGRLKNNLTVRISGRQSNKRNASVAGTEGAEQIKITDKGRMIFVLDEPIEVQSPWIEYDDAKELLAPFKVKKSFDVETNEKPTKSNEFQFGILEAIENE